MSFVILHHAPLGRNLNPHVTEQVTYLMTYLDFMADQKASGKYIGGKLQFDEARDPEFEINIFRFQEDHIHNENLYLLFELNMSLTEFTASQGDLWTRVMKQVHFHRASGAGDVLNIYEAGNSIVFVMQRSAAMEKVVTAQMRSELKAV